MFKKRGDMRVSRSDTRSEDKFVHPFTGDEMAINSQNLQGSSGDYRFLAEKNGYGKKIVFGIPDRVFKSFITSDKVEPETLKDMFGGQTWDECKRAVSLFKCFGLGPIVARRKDEKPEDLQRPIGLCRPGDVSFFAVDPTELTPTMTPVIALDWSAYGNWRWHGHTIDASRLSFFRPVKKMGETGEWMGIGDIESCYVPLLCLEMLARGSLNRTVVWSILKILEKHESGKMNYAQKQSFINIKDNFLRGDRIPVDTSDDVLFLKDTSQSGTELRDLLMGFVTSGTEIPKMVFHGDNVGTVKGSEVVYTQLGEKCTNDQSNFTRLLAEMATRFFGLDIGEIDWNVEFFNSRAQQIKIELAELELDFAKQNPEEYFGGGSRSEPIEGVKEEGEEMLS